DTPVVFVVAADGNPLLYQRVCLAQRRDYGVDLGRAKQYRCVCLIALLGDSFPVEPGRRAQIRDFGRRIGDFRLGKSSGQQELLYNGAIGLQALLQGAQIIVEQAKLDRPNREIRRHLALRQTLYAYVAIKSFRNLDRARPEKAGGGESDG